MMRGIRGVPRPELRMRDGSHVRGVLYWLNAKSLPYKSDLAPREYKILIFVHGGFCGNITVSGGAVSPARTHFWKRS